MTKKTKNTPQRTSCLLLSFSSLWRNMIKKEEDKNLTKNDQKHSTTSPPASCSASPPSAGTYPLGSGPCPQCVWGAGGRTPPSLSWSFLWGRLLHYFYFFLDDEILIISQILIISLFLWWWLSLTIAHVGEGRREGSMEEFQRRRRGIALHFRFI